MIVPDAPLVAGNGPGRLNAPNESNLGECVQRVVHRLMRHLGEVFPDSADDGLGVCVLVIAHSRQNRDPLFRHAKGTVPQCCGRFGFVPMLVLSHSYSLPPFLESVKEANSPGARAIDRHLPRVSIRGECLHRGSGGCVVQRTVVGFDQMHATAIF